MTKRWAAAAKAKQGTMPPARLLIETQREALACGHGFTKYEHQAEPELLDLEDEVRELAQAIRSGEGEAAVRNEIGDVMFSLLNVCRAKGVDLDAALEAFAQRWLTRKVLQEEMVFARGYTWATLPQSVSDEIWVELKQKLKQQEMAA